MNALELLPQIGKADPARVYLLCPGKAPRARQATYEPFLAERVAQRLVDAYMDEAARDMCYAVFYADETPPERIASEAETLPFMAERRVVLVRNAEKYVSESAAKPLLRYLESPNESTVLIFVSAKADKRTKFYKACESAGEIIECPVLNAREIAQWVKDELKVQGKKADRDAIQTLIDRAGVNLADVHNAVTLVSAFVGDTKKTVSTEDVVLACADVAEEEIWALTDAIAASQVGPALGALHGLLDLGKAPDEIMGTINWLLTSAYRVARKDDNVSRFVAQKVEPLARKIGLRKLPDAFRLCTQTHFTLRSTGVNAPLALELLVVKLAAPRKSS